ncbi:MAG TPA: hypothetical protein VL996_01830 [Methylocella sp.]|nr:hypothetical protein [Methylocella sp.]
MTNDSMKLAGVCNLWPGRPCTAMAAKRIPFTPFVLPMPPPRMPIYEKWQPFDYWLESNSYFFVGRRGPFMPQRRRHLQISKGTLPILVHLYSIFIIER